MDKLQIKNASMLCYDAGIVLIDFELVLQNPKYNMMWVGCSLAYKTKTDELKWQKKLELPAGFNITETNAMEEEIKAIAEEFKHVCINIREKAKTTKYLYF